jgi:uncharacterized caspase-like protein
LDSRTPLRNKAFQSVQATILTNKDATKEAILKVVDDICSDIVLQQTKRKKRQRDVLLIFLAGHGIRLINDDTQEQDLYFGTHNLNYEEITSTGLSFIELGEKITAVPADVILMTDACHSGIAGRDVIEGLDPNELAKRIYAINERGMYILNAARSVEKAIESDRNDIRHGIFTKVILKTLDVDTDTSMVQLIASVQQNVPKITTQRQTPICRVYGDLLPLVVYKK